MTTETKYLTTKQAMAYLNLKRPDTIYKWIAAGKLKAYRHGPESRYRFIISDLDTFIRGESNG